MQVKKTYWADVITLYSSGDEVPSGAKYMSSLKIDTGGGDNEIVHYFLTETKITKVVEE